MADQHITATVTVNHPDGTTSTGTMHVISGCPIDPTEAAVIELRCLLKELQPKQA